MADRGDAAQQRLRRVERAGAAAGVAAEGASDALGAAQVGAWLGWSWFHWWSPGGLLLITSDLLLIYW